VSAPEQRTLDWVKGAAPEEVHAAVNAGELDDVLSGRTPALEPLTREQIEQVGGMTPEQLVEQAQTNPDMARRIGADQGARGERASGAPTPSILDGKGPREIARMLRDGDLDDLLGRPKS
jgi:hypothetical protein